MEPLPESPARPRIGPGVEVGVTEPMIRDMVFGFYAKVRRDPALGPIFEGAIGDGWDEHLEKMCDFWSSVLLMSGRFKGSPMTAHARTPGIEYAHFGRWLTLFRETAAEVCPPRAALLFVAKAEMIAESLKLGIAVSRGETPPLSARA
jgi:hemoglobin